MTAVREADRKDRDLGALAVLALLSTGPRHPYDLHRFLLDTGKRFVKGLPRSLYHAVDKLERDGLIKSSGTQSQPGRPDRTVYAITDAGRKEVRRRVKVLLTTPISDADITYAALSFISVLPREQAISVLRVRTAAIDKAIDQQQADLGSATEVPRVLLVESEFELTRLRAERDWTASIADQIESGTLEWLDAISK